MSEQRGVVASLHEKDWNGTMLYSFKLEGVERFWRLGQKKPDFKVKDLVKFTERNSNADWDSIAVIPSANVAVLKPDQPTEVAAPTDVGKRMQYQAARRDATSLVVAALHTEALPWTAVQQKNKSKKLDLLTGYIEQVTKTLLDQEDTQ
jgi:hypothetical protein